MKKLIMLLGIVGVFITPSFVAQAATEARTQSPGLVGPAPTAAAKKTESQTKAVTAVAKSDNDAKQDPGEELKIKAVAVLKGKGVQRKLADVVRDSVEDALSEEGTIGSNDLNRLLVRVRQNLINQGYYLSRIKRVGPNGGTTAEGILPLQLQVGTVQDIEVNFAGKEKGEDGTYFTRQQIQDRFDGVKEGDSFNYGKLYLALYGLNANPDLQADVNVGVHNGAGEDGDSTAKFALTVEESMPLHGSLEINNYAIEALDDWQAIGMIQYANLTKADDVLTFTPGISLNGDQWSVGANYMRPFSFFKGGHFSIWGGYTDTDIDNMDVDVLDSLVFESTGYFVGGQINFNLIDTTDHLLQAFFGIQYRYIEQNLEWLDVDLSKYKVGVLPITAGLSYMNRSLDGFFGRNFLTVSASYNVSDFHDEVRKIWLDAEEHYSLFRAQYARIQPLFGQPTLDQGFDSMWTAFFKAEAQWSNQSLISQEALLLGGHSTVRGYRTYGYAGDRGVYGTLEFRTPVWRDLVGGFFNDSENSDSWFDAVQLFAFVDYGFIDRERTRYAQSCNQSLISAGLGARIQLTKYLSLNGDFAFPLREAGHENEEHDKDFEAYFGVRAQF